MQEKTAQKERSGPACVVPGLIGRCGDREVFVGFATGALLNRLSFSDVLDEARGEGYQRRFCKDHSLAFKRYIQQPGATTIPLTFNLRGAQGVDWRLERGEGGTASLVLTSPGGPVMAQVDCQHRLGYLRESAIPFAFMAFLGLSVPEEMEIFRDINGKAKGLSSSLLDYTDAKLAQADLAVAHPEIALALRLQEDEDSPWHLRLDLGGDRTNGTQRLASLRTMQKAIRRFRREAGLEALDLEDTGRQLIDFWKAIVRLYPYQWVQPRRHLLNKGVGVYSLMSMAGILVAEAKARGRVANHDYFVEMLSDFSDRVDWSNKGVMRGFGGATGADRAFELIRSIRQEALRGTYGKQEHPAH